MLGQRLKFLSCTLHKTLPPLSTEPKKDSSKEVRLSMLFHFLLIIPALPTAHECHDVTVPTTAPRSVTTPTASSTPSNIEGTADLCTILFLRFWEKDIAFFLVCQCDHCFYLNTLVGFLLDSGCDGIASARLRSVQEDDPWATAAGGTHRELELSCGSHDECMLQGLLAAICHYEGLSGCRWVGNTACCNISKYLPYRQCPLPWQDMVQTFPTWIPQPKCLGPCNVLPCESLTT